MRPKRIVMDLAAVDPNSVFEDQTLGGAGNFSLDGVGVNSDGHWVSPDEFPHKISFESTGDHSARTFTVTGYLDKSLNFLVTEDVTGPNNSTVESTNYFYKITNIASDGAVATNVESGFVDKAVSPVIPLNHRGNDIAIHPYVSGTVDYTVQYTFEDVQDGNYPSQWKNHDDSDFVNATSTVSGNYIQIPIATRLVVNSYSSDPTITLTLTQKDR